MNRRANVVTDGDIALLRSLRRERSVVAASRSLGISRDRAVYRLDRLARAFGGPVVTGTRGGRGHGGSRLTELGTRVVRGGFGSLEMLEARPRSVPATSNVLDGVYHRAPFPVVAVGRTLRLRVAFGAEEGERVSVRLDPESVLVARRRFASSARNVLPATVVAVRPRGPDGRTLLLRTGTVRLRAAVTPEPVRQLGLRRGAKVVLYVKATALRRVGAPGRLVTRGSPRP